MANNKHLTAPDPNETGWPRGVPYIIGNEGCERFSFYGMKAILQVHLTILFVIDMGLADTLAAAEAFVNAGGEASEGAKSAAQAVVHLFIAGTYALPMIGAIIADRLFGKYNTILWLSLVYCAGHAVLAVGENSLPGMYLGLGLIALGAGGIKPCVSAHVGDQFGDGNKHLVEKVFQAFYFIINFGSFFATLAIPLIRKHLGTSVAFGIPGVLMFIATFVFWMGRTKFVHVPARPGGKLGALDAASSVFLFLTFGSLFFTASKSIGVIIAVSLACFAVGIALFLQRQKIEQDDGFLAVLLYSFQTWRSGEGAKAAHETTSDHELAKSPFWGAAFKKFGEQSAEGPLAVLRIISVFFLVSVFWALFDQHASSWVRQAQDMDLKVDLGFFSGELLPSQIQALNPMMVMILIPFASFMLYPGITKLGFTMTPLRRMSIGMFVAALAYVTVALVQARIDAEGRGAVSVLWQVIPYLVMTLSEVMVSITGLEFAYTQAPTRMKSTIMGFWLLTVALGNVLVAILSNLPDMTLVKFFWLFAGLMAAAAVLFSVMAYFYKGKTYIQGGPASE